MRGEGEGRGGAPGPRARGRGVAPAERPALPSAREVIPAAGSDDRARAEDVLLARIGVDTRRRGG